MNVTKGLRTFLGRRSRHIHFEGSVSSTRPCPAGVPQGFVRSPTATLFNVHIYERPRKLRSRPTSHQHMLIRRRLYAR